MTAQLTSALCRSADQAHANDSCMVSDERRIVTITDPNPYQGILARRHERMTRGM